ncbi:unnamed protein product, partial [marine sediment metagenome]
AAKIQFAREIERFLSLRVHVLRPASHPGPVKVKGENWHEFRSRHKGQKMSPKMMGEAWLAHRQEHGIDGRKTVEEYVEACLVNGSRPFVVVGWEALVDNIKDLERYNPSTLVCDELHAGKSTKRWDVVHLPDLSEDPTKSLAQMRKEDGEARSQGGFIKDTEEGRKMLLPVLNQASAAARLARRASKRIGLTATPIKDRVRDLWGQLDTIEPNSHGNSSMWRSRYCDMKPGRYGGMDDRGSSNLDELKRRISHVAHILTYAETHKHLPPKRRQSVYIAPEDQCRPSGGFAKELRDAQKRGPSAVLEVRLAQAASKKRKAVLSMIEDHLSSGQKVTVFTGRRRDCDELGQMVRKLNYVKKHNTSVWSAHGEQSTEARQLIVDDYMDHPGPCALVGTGHSFGESLNINDTDAAFFVMLPYTPGQLRQWEGRFHRASSTKPVV